MATIKLAEAARRHIWACQLSGIYTQKNKSKPLNEVSLNLVKTCQSGLTFH